MRLSALIAILLALTACSTVDDKSHPYAEPNALMRQEIQARIANIPFQHRQELINNLLWLAARGGESAIPDLLIALTHDEPKVRSSAAWVLGRIRDRRVIPELRPLAEDGNEAVRFEAARSLTLMGDMKYATLLIEGLDSDRIPVRYNCHMALRDATERDFQYDHLEDDPVERHMAVLRWREWWSEMAEDPYFAHSYAKKYGLETHVVMPKPPHSNPGQPAPLGEIRPGGEPFQDAGNRDESELRSRSHDDNAGVSERPGRSTEPMPGAGSEAPAPREKTTSPTGSEGRAVTEQPRASTETSPGQTSPAQTSPAQTSPGQPGPAQTSPAQTSPTQTSPTQTSPGQTSPGQTGKASAEGQTTGPAQDTSPPDAAPIQAMPVPVKDESGKAGSPTPKGSASGVETPGDAGGASTDRPAKDRPGAETEKKAVEPWINRVLDRVESNAEEKPVRVPQAVPPVESGVAPTGNSPAKGQKGGDSKN